jgi:hypothetical protein
MLYTKQQVEVMLDMARTQDTSVEEIISSMPSVQIPEDDEINDVAYDTTDTQEAFKGFKEGGEYVADLIIRRATRVNNELDVTV